VESALERRAVTETASPQAGLPAAWYPDPRDPRAWRYWTGDAWTEHVADSIGRSIVDPVGTTALPIPSDAELAEHAHHRDRTRKRIRIESLIVLPLALVFVLGTVSARWFIDHHFRYVAPTSRHVVLQAAGQPAVPLVVHVSDGDGHVDTIRLPQGGTWSSDFTADSGQYLSISGRSGTSAALTTCRIAVSGRAVVSHRSDGSHRVARCDAVVRR
jgi:hypothetical protein